MANLLRRGHDRGDGALPGDRPADGATSDHRHGDEVKHADGKHTTHDRDRHDPDTHAGTATRGFSVERQHVAYGGTKLGAAFFGWLSANGLAVVLVALLSAAGVAVQLTRGEGVTVDADAETVGLAGGITLLVILMIAYFAGGYVAGRMSRFDGARQGMAVWAIGLFVIVVLAAAGALLGAEYNVFNQLDLPRIPIDEGTLTTGGIIALVAVMLGTLLAAVVGGKAGVHYHRKVDRV